ncbi:MAG: hypothetical protein OEU50_21650 [Gammaproteobacteria bacterium]|nr:hypothetical protein [Gammaproteobacteria bacterium]
MRLAIFLFLIGGVLLSAILGLFWMKDRLENQLLARITRSGLVARLAVLGAAFAVLGLLLMLSELVGGWAT